MPIKTSYSKLASFFAGGIGAGVLFSNRSLFMMNKKPAVSVVRMTGIIQGDAGGPSSPFSKRNINLSNYEETLEKAFEQPNIKAVSLILNSPGGSPVQSSLIFNKLKSLRKKHQDIKVICFCEDVCASGGYYIASACDEILVDKSTIIGSIGVVSAGFGFHDMIKWLGVDRRVQTVGKAKVTNDPFQPQDENGKRQSQFLMETIFEHFVECVKEGRGEKLKEDIAKDYSNKIFIRSDEEDRISNNSTEKQELPSTTKTNEISKEGLFDGSVYDGVTAVKIGLADELYQDMKSEMRQRFGEDIEFKEVRSGKQGLLSKLQLLCK